MTSPLTVESISEALKGNDFWLSPASDAARIVKEAVLRGYLKRSSRTQVQWTEQGLAAARVDLVAPWTAEQLAGLCRGLGMTEFKGWPGFFSSNTPSLTVIPCEPFAYRPDATVRTREFEALPRDEQLAQTVDRVMLTLAPELLLPAEARSIPTEFKGMTDDGLACYSVDERILGR